MSSFLETELAQSLLNGVGTPVDVRHERQIKLLTCAVLALTEEVQRLSAIISGENATINFTTGSSSLQMRKDGTITLKGKDITLEATGRINVKSAGHLNLRGQKIVEN
mgnify:CR=1 FL=1